MDIKEHQQVWHINLFHEKTGSGVRVNEKLAEDLHKPVLKIFKRKRMYGKFKYNIWAAELAEIGSLSFKNKNVKY